MKLLTFTAAACLTAGAVFADGVNEAETTPVVTPPVPVNTTADFSGAYGGLGLGIAQGEIGYFGNDDDVDFNDGTAISLFGGYNIQNGNLVYGGEIGYSQLSDFYVVPDFGDDDVIESLIDLRGRVGYVTGDVLIYGALGYSFGEYVEPGVSTFEMSGLSVGAGAEYLVTDNIFVGADYTMRMLEGNEVVTDVEAASNVSTFTLRVGYSF